MTQRLAIIGYGKMGRAIEALAPSHEFDVVSRIDPGGGDAKEVSRETLKKADVAVEFTVPGSAPANVLAAIAAGCPVVVGTTGWYDRREEIEGAAKKAGVGILIAPNFSIGVAAFLEIARAAARTLTGAGFDAHIVETHHTAKKDAPSGTAAALQGAVQDEWDGELPITSVRVGAVPGTHELLFDAPFEQIRLEHVARDRRVFADGALRAASWLARRKSGVFTMADVIREKSNG